MYKIELDTTATLFPIPAFLNRHCFKNDFLMFFEKNKLVKVIARNQEISTARKELYVDRVTTIHPTHLSNKT